VRRAAAIRAPHGRIDAYLPRLDWVSQHVGYLNRTLFCFGYMLTQSDVNSPGWTKASLRAEMVQVSNQSGSI
jgi:hypothetical protein